MKKTRLSDRQFNSLYFLIQIYFSNTKLLTELINLHTVTVVKIRLSSMRFMMNIVTVSQTKTNRL